MKTTGKNGRSQQVPNSSKNGKSEILEWFKSQSDIKTIVDVGAGSGTYPKLLAPADYYWIGVEIFIPYVKRFELKKYYDDLILDDITKIELPDADCIIFGDILEHLVVAEVRRLVELSDKKYKHVVVSIPIDSYQRAVENNQYEKHRSIWSSEQLEQLFPESFKIRKQFDNIYIFIK